MKKIIIGLVGCGVIAGVVAYTLYVKEKTSKENISKNTEPTYTPTEKNSVDDDLYQNEVTNMVYDKKSSVESISQRHREAAEIMKGSVESIFSEDEKQGHNEKELNNISDELDDILKEID